MTALTDPWTADEVEAMFHAALKAGDVKGVDAALRVMVRLDPDRANDLYDTLKLAVKEARRLRGDAARSGTGSAD